MLDQFILKIAEAKELQRLNTLEHEDTKFHFAYIAFELTRKCNLKCAHCLRGEWQNLTMTKEVIDKMLEVSSGIDFIFFTGGEPFLAPDLIEHIVDRVIALDFDAKYISVITNGTILNSLGIRSVQAMNRFAEWSYKKNGIEQAASITISNDIYHGTTPQEAVDFYSAYVNEKYTKVEIQEKETDQLENLGRAKINHLPETIQVKVHALPRRIRINEDNSIPCILNLTPHGNLNVIDFHSWEEIDANPLGNIMEESLVRMFERNQWPELPCNEVKRLGRYINAHAQTEIEKTLQESMTKGYNAARTLRYNLHLMLPYLDYATIYHASELLMQLMTEMNWLAFTKPDYDKVEDQITPEFLRQGLRDCETMNNYYKKQGKKKVQLVPYNPDNKTIENCADLDAQDE